MNGIDHKTLGPFDAIYTFVADNGTTWNIHAERLRLHLIALDPKTRPPLQRVPVFPEIAKNYILDNAVSIDRVRGLTLQHLIDPVIFVKYQISPVNGLPDVMHVDGHHRYVRFALDGHPFIPAYILEEDFWHPFRILGMPSMTKDELRAVPITKRSY